MTVYILIRRRYLTHGSLLCVCVRIGLHWSLRRLATRSYCTVVCIFRVRMADVRESATHTHTQCSEKFSTYLYVWGAEMCIVCLHFKYNHNHNGKMYLQHIINRSHDHDHYSMKIFPQMMHCIASIESCYTFTYIKHRKRRFFLNILHI